ncbi:MAG: hypothetical protein FJ211_09495 [Ignavibacteria bacterium]|nr:hypothetical protein [Ignavibacteria bacterium]
MTKQHYTLDYDTWAKQFKPMINYIDPDASFNQTMFETYGDEVEHVCDRANTPDTALTVWTYIDGFLGTYIVEGYRHVNRIGHFVTEKPADANATYEITVDKYDDNDEWDSTTNDGIPELEVLETPYFAGCDRIWARIDGQDSELSYEQVRTSRAIYTREETFDGEQTIMLSDGRKAQVQSIDLRYNNKEPIGAQITYYWKDSDPDRQGLWGGYVSFGDYDEATSTDTYGNHDDFIHYYFPDGVMEMVAYMMENKGEFTIVEYVYAYHE